MPCDLVVLSRYERLGASSRVRTLQYLPCLHDLGISTVVCPLFDDAYVKARNSDLGAPSIGQVLRAYARRLRTAFDIGRAQAVWLEYEMLPWLPFAFERWLYRSKRSVIVDYDDAIFHRYDAHRSPLVRAALRTKIDRIMSAATVVIAGNDYLAQRAERAGAKRVEVVPSVVDLSQYRQRNDARARDAFVIGWVGSRSTAPYLRTLEPAIRALSARVPAKVINIGGSIWSPPAIEVRNVPWSEATEVEHMLEFDVGVMPLPDEPWTRGKCGYKLIQYMACALPTVAAPVGINREIVAHGKTGYLATTPDEWLEALEALAGSPTRRQAMGRAGHAEVAARFSLTVTAPRIAAIVESVLTARPGVEIQPRAG